ncbi:hypothetical protein CMV_007776 [Castanea mollissima]|uniref:USP domain-containing protein n=1 Tax=Castanea mollissima TaxID=60419 RepID=A0A8J4VSE6_9ROSI|nr:hypothetical protein CMV_007776 [Castanea mollissima]
MHKCCLPSGVPSESPGAYEKSLVHKIFGGRLRSQVKCLQCSYCSNKFDPFLDLSLEIVQADSWHKALANFTAAEQLDGGERQYQCQQCKQKVRALKQLTVHKAPYVLAIYLKRFHSHDPGQMIKKKVHIGPTIDLKPFVSGSYGSNTLVALMEDPILVSASNSFKAIPKRKTSVAHMDSPNIVDMGLSQMSSRVIGHNLDAELDVHLVGGFEDVSPNVWLRILYIISKDVVIRGYQEILTDPSYAGQFVLMTNPHISNTGVNFDDEESMQCFLGGLVIRSLSISTSNWRCAETLGD